MPAPARSGRLDHLRARHEKFLADYVASVDALDRKINDFNLSVPVSSLQLARFNRQRALDQASSAVPSEIQR
ncbi:MAG TPA: hypothetical protein VNL16_15640 [Chloroflexota bacterium]|nr:hypothetical protein [Chloroflexota bacterium]